MAFSFVAIMMTLGCLATCQAADISIVDLMINGLEQEDALSAPFPQGSPIVLAWRLVGHSSSVTGFEIEVTSQWTESPPSVKWSSGMIESNRTSFRLPDSVFNKNSGAGYYSWRVKVVELWSESATFDIAPASVFEDSKWIGGGSEVMQTIQLSTAQVTHARAYCAGLGSYKLFINGLPVDNHIMDAGEAVYDQKVLFVGHNITHLLKSGSNTIMARIGNSKWGYLDIYTNRSAAGDQSGDATRAFILDMSIEQVGGAKKRVISDGSWTYRHGPIVYDHLWHGEIFDTRQINATVAPAKLMTPKAGKFFPQLMPPIRITQDLHPVSISASANGSLLYDFGFNGAGFTTIEISQTTVDVSNLESSLVMLRMEHTEILDPNLDAYNNYYPGMEFKHASKTCSMSDWYQRKWYECANQTDGIVFVWPLTKPLVYTPTFTYHGFRYVGVSAVTIDSDGKEHPISMDTFKDAIKLTAHRAHTDLKPAMKVDLSNVRQHDQHLLQQIFNATISSHVSNVWSIPTDCPQREKRGWMGDAGITSSSLQTFFDAFAFHTNFLRLIVDNQLKGCGDQPHTTIYGPCMDKNGGTSLFNGSVPDVTPFATGPYGGNPGSTDWQVTFVVVARNILLHYGDSAVPVLEEIWDRLVAFMDYLKRFSDLSTGLLLYGARGDWVPPHGSVKATAEECSAFWYAICLGYMGEIADAIGLQAEAQKYKAAFAQNKLGYHAHFYNAQDKHYGTGSQASAIFPLYLGAVPSNIEPVIVEALVASIKDNKDVVPVNPPSGPHLEMGIFGTTFVFDVLQRYGYESVGLAVLNETTQPSLGYMIANGATTLWEAWDGDQHHIGTEGTSRNHIMFGGGVNRFIASAVGGLGIDAKPYSNALGWRRLSVRPSSSAMRIFGSSSASRKTPQGIASVSWKKPTTSDPGNQFLTLNVSVPFGTTADVRIPLENSLQIVEHGSCSMGCTFNGNTVLISAPSTCNHLCTFREHDGEVAVELSVGSGEHSFYAKADPLTASTK